MSHYDVLGAPENAAYRVIRSKYRAAILALHPDKFGNVHEQFSDTLKELGVEHHRSKSPTTSNAGEFSVDKEDVASRFFRVREAWEVLKDPDSRQKYDMLLSKERLDLEISSRGESARLIGEEVSLREMNSLGVPGEVQYWYACQCGDRYVISHEEIYITVAEYKEEIQDEAMESNRLRIFENGKESCGSGNAGDVASELKGSGRPLSRVLESDCSIDLPCTSCSLHLRLLVPCTTEI